MLMTPSGLSLVFVILTVSSATTQIGYGRLGLVRTVTRWLRVVSMELYEYRTYSSPVPNPSFCMGTRIGSLQLHSGRMGRCWHRAVMTRQCDCGIYASQAPNPPSSTIRIE